MRNTKLVLVLNSDSHSENASVGPLCNPWPIQLYHFHTLPLQSNINISQINISHHSAPYSDVWGSHQNASNIEFVRRTACLLVGKSLFECLLWRSWPKILVKISALLLADSTKMISTTPSSQYSLTYLVCTPRVLYHLSYWCFSTWKVPSYCQHVR